MRTAIFTDNDFDKVNGVTTTLKAVLKYAPPGVEARVYTAADLGVQADDYFVAESRSPSLARSYRRVSAESVFE